MFLVLLSSFFIVPVLSEALPPPPPPLPQDIQVDKWLLTWTPAATEEGNVTYTVQYSSFDRDEWASVPACIHIFSNSCNVTATRAEGEHGCVRLRVQAERRGLKSSFVEACSQHGDTCSPEVRLTALPGSLVVHLSRNHELAQEHGDHAKHRVYYGKEGTPLEDFKEEVSTVTVPDLEEGQRYCVKLQYIYMDDPVGLPSCPQCVLIPTAEKDSNQTTLIVSLVVVVLLVILIPLIVYVLIHHWKKVKGWMQPPCQIPPHFLELKPITPPHPPNNTSCCIEKPCDALEIVNSSSETEGSRANPEDEMSSLLLATAGLIENCREEELKFDRRVVFTAGDEMELKRGF